MTFFEIFSFKRALKQYFARRDGEVRFYPFGVMGRGWVVEESQVPNLERCVAAFSYGGALLMVPYFLLLQHGFHLLLYHYLWDVLLLIYALYWIAVRFFARGKGGRVKRVPTAVLLRDMALSQSPERLGWRIAACVVIVVACPIGVLVMIGTSPLAVVCLVAAALFFGLTLRRLFRVQRVQKELGPHADTTAVFD